MTATLVFNMPKKIEASSEFGRRLVAIRNARGFTQVQLADSIGSSQRAISRYETVADFPPAPVVVQLAKALHVSSDELLGLQNNKAAQPRDLLDPKTKRLWKKFQQVIILPEKDQRAVIRLINSLVAAQENRHSKAAAAS